MKKWIDLTKKSFCAVMTCALALTGAQSLTAQKWENSLLWKVEGRGIQTSYVFGTLHVLPQSEFELKDKVTNAMVECKLLALELDMSDPAMPMKMMQLANMKGGTTLNELLDAPTYRKLDTLLMQSLGASVMFVNGFKPFVVSNMLIGRFIEGQQASFELSLIEFAKEKGIPVKGLETLEEQMGFFDDVPYASQAKDLAEMVNEEEKIKEMYARMIKLYRNEEVEKLYSMLRDYMDDPSELNIMLNKRNERWVPMMEKWSADKPVFYAVGAGHLPGEKGVLSLLKAAGYEVTPVK